MPIKFLLFAGETCYPDGGWSDFVGAFDDEQAAIAEGRRLMSNVAGYRNWFHVVRTDLASYEIVYDGLMLADGSISSPDKLNSD